MINQEATKTFLETFSKQHNITVTYDNSKEPVATGQGHLILPHPTIDNEEVWQGQTHRELSYLMKDNRFLFNAQRRYKEGTPYHSVASILADHIAERKDYGEYRGRARYLTNNRCRIMEPIIDAVGEVQEKQLTPESEVVRSLLQYDLKERQKWMTGGTLKALKGFKDCKYTGNIQKALESVDLSEVKTEAQFQRLVEQIIHVLEEPPEPEYEEGEGEGESENQGQGQQKGEGNAESSGENEGEGEGSEGENGEGGEGKGEGKGKERSEDGEEAGEGQEGNNEDLTAGDESRGSGSDDIGSEGTGQSALDDKLSKLIQQSFKDVKKDLQNYKVNERKYRENYSNHTYSPCSARKVITGDTLTNDGVESQSLYHKEQQDENIRQLLDTASKYPISKKLRKYLQVLRTSRYTYGLKKGKLNNARLARVMLGDRQPRIYKDRQSSKLEFDTAVSVLIDCSGSMYGRKEFVANTIAVCVADVLKSIQVSHEILGFSDNRRLNHMIFKDYEENLHREALGKRLCSLNKQGGGNSDGDSILWAAERLLYRPESNKVMIVLSDGQPAGSYKGSGSDYLKKVCQRIESKAPMTLWGVGILTTAPRNFYRNYKLCDRLEELESLVISIIKQSIIK